MDKRELRILQELHRVQAAEIREKIKAQKARTRLIFTLGSIVLDAHPELMQIPINDVGGVVKDILA